MTTSPLTANTMRFRIVVILSLMVLYAFLTFFFQLHLQVDVVYTHFAYIPIVLAGVWWGLRGAVVSILLALFMFGFRVTEGGVGFALSDAARAASFIIVSFSVGILSKRLLQSRGAVSRSEERYRMLIEKSLAGIFVYRGERVLFTNTRFSEMFGYGKQELAGMPLWELIHPDDRAWIRSLVERRSIEGSSDLHHECRYLRKSGEVLWVDVASSLIEFEGESAVIVNLYNITGRKKAERKEKELADLAEEREQQLIHSTRLAELGEMTAGVAHEINQPLTGIRNFAKNAIFMIQEGAGKPREVESNLRLISEQVDRASRIISRMRELTRRSDGRFGRVDLTRALSKALEFLGPQFRESAVDVVRHCVEGPLEVWGDQIQIEQVFLNLATNAIHAMVGTVRRRLEIHCFIDPRRPDMAVVLFKDWGKGFSEDEREKLFAPFYSTRETGEGTGLGLSISLKIVKDHQGNIEAAGIPGEGAAFRVEFPLITRDRMEDEP